MVVTELPSAWTARQVHDRTATPSSSTVQAPHWLVSQPILVPVTPRDREKVHQQQPGFHIALVHPAVHSDPNWKLHGASRLS